MTNENVRRMIKAIHQDRSGILKSGFRKWRYGYTKDAIASYQVRAREQT